MVNILQHLSKGSKPVVQGSKPLINVYKALVRHYRALAFESSCDDTCVALLERTSPNTPVKVIAELKETLNSTKTGGVVPLDAVHFHQKNVARMVAKLASEHGFGPSSPPDLICVTRGPGMMGSLTASLQFAKGLAVAWDRPLVGAHHMLGHLLTPKLPQKNSESCKGPEYPFLSLLCSGGHTMLVLLSTLDKHEVLVDTIDIAAGDALDKAARELGMLGNMIGPVLEKFVNDIDVVKKEAYSKIDTNGKDPSFPLNMPKPLVSSKHSKIPDSVKFSFASFPSAIQHFCKNVSLEGPQREFAAFKLQETLFDHIVDRINVAFKKSKNIDGRTGEIPDLGDVKDFVCSGGVAANLVLREKLKQKLNTPQPMNFHFPDLSLCTDNAAMIGNVGMEIFENLRVKSDLGILAIRKWPMGDLLAVDGWEPVSDEEYKRVTGF